MSNKNLVYGVLGVLCIAAFFLYSCTGGSNPATNYNVLLSGNYQVHKIGDAAASAVTETARVDVIADGAGAGTMNIAAGNHSGGITGSGTYSYAVAADRTFSITTSTGTVNGMVSATGSHFILSDTNRTVSVTPPLENTGVVMAAGIKKTSGLANAILNGNYQIHQAGDAGAGLYTSRVDIIATGTGTGTWTIVGHSAGGAGSTGNFTYNVNTTDGTFSVTTKDISNAITIGTDYGIMLADGSLFLLTDTNPTTSVVPPIEDSEIIMAVGLKKSSGLTNAVLHGNYQIHQVGRDTSGRYTARVNITADGAGNGTWAIASHSAGNTGNGIFAYTVAADGTFSVTTKDATGTLTIGTDYGIVSADGSLFAITDTNPIYSAGVEEAEIILSIGMKK